MIVMLGVLVSLLAPTIRSPIWWFWAPFFTLAFFPFLLVPGALLGVWMARLGQWQSRWQAVVLGGVTGAIFGLACLFATTRRNPLPDLLLPSDQPALSGMLEPWFAANFHVVFFAVWFAAWAAWEVWRARRVRTAPTG
jgi:uncharacterized membrane protein HdeD (DUF308 family)